MTVLQLRRDTLATVVAETIREDLLSGAVRPGTVLDCATLATRIGSSRATVREALAELTREGLVVHSLQGGFEVTRIERADVRDIYAARHVYEAAGLDALLARRPVDVGWLIAAVERMDEAAVLEDFRAAVEADMAFHLALVAATGSRRLTAATQGALRELRLILSVADQTTSDLPGLVADHRRLAEAIRAGRRRAATAALEEHLAHGESLAAAVA